MVDQPTQPVSLDPQRDEPSVTAKTFYLFDEKRSA